MSTVSLAPSLSARSTLAQRQSRALAIYLKYSRLERKAYGIYRRSTRPETKARYLALSRHYRTIYERACAAWHYWLDRYMAEVIDPILGL